MRDFISRPLFMPVRGLSQILMVLALGVVIFWLNVKLFSMIASFILGMAVGLYLITSTNWKHTRK